MPNPADSVSIGAKYVADAKTDVAEELQAALNCCLIEKAYVLADGRLSENAVDTETAQQGPDWASSRDILTPYAAFGCRGRKVIDL